MRFRRKYGEQYVMKDSVVARLTRATRSILRLRKAVYEFRYGFVYYFFLGYHMARHFGECRGALEELSRNSDVRDNTFVLIFTVHHTQDERLLDLVVARTLQVYEDLEPASLAVGESQALEIAIDELPAHVLGSESVATARLAERRYRDTMERHVAPRRQGGATGRPPDGRRPRALRNMEVLGQIVKTKYGSLSRARLGEIVSAISGASRRLIAYCISEEGIQRMEKFLLERARELELGEEGERMAEFLRKHMRGLVAIAVLAILDKTAACIRKPELDGVVQHACDTSNTPADALLYFQFVLNTAKELQLGNVKEMERLLGDFQRSGNRVAERLLSLTVQGYLQTHEVDYTLRQRVYTRLGLPYRANRRLKA